MNKISNIQFLLGNITFGIFIIFEILFMVAGIVQYTRTRNGLAFLVIIGAGFSFFVSMVRLVGYLALNLMPYSKFGMMYSILGFLATVGLMLAAIGVLGLTDKRTSV
jgi:hypothetical protein